MGINIKYPTLASLNWTKEYLIEVLSGGSKPIITDPQIINAFLRIDRKDFLPFNLQYLAYNDIAIDLGNDIKLEKPTTIARTLSHLKPVFGGNYLIVGTGCAYTTAIIAFIAGERGKIYSIEKNMMNINLAKTNLQKYPKIRNIELKFKNYSNGLLEKAPFDGIYVDEFVTGVSDLLRSQLINNGGKLVCPTEKFNFKVIQRQSNTEYEEEIIDYISVARI